MNTSNPLGVSLKPYNRILAKYECFTGSLCPYTLASSDIISALGPEIKNWTIAQPVIINAHTGSGKSTFILNSLIDYAIKKGKKVLWLSHRLGICMQQKHRFLDKYRPDIKNDYTEQGLQKKSDFGSVCIMTYQQLAVNLSNSDFNFSSYHYVVFDECHYFSSDTLFSDTSDRLLWKIPKVFQESIRVYMTATLDTVLPLICAAESTWRVPISAQVMNLPILVQPRIMLLYQVPTPKYTYNMNYFTALDEIVQKIFSDTSEDKWLIFVDSKKEGQRYATQLGEKACYLDADRKNSKEWNALITENKFSSKALFCTSVLDCGINIIDESLKNVVLTTPHKDSFLQMLGRNRKKGSYNVYVQLLELEDIHRLQAPVDRLLNSLDQLNSSKTERDKTNFLRQLIENADSDECQIYWLDNNRIPNVKQSAEYMLNFYHERYRQLEERIKADGSFAFAVEVCSWLGQDMPIPGKDIDLSTSKEAACSEIIKILEGHLEKPFTTKKEQDELSSQLKPYFITLCGPEAQDSRALGAAAITNRLEKSDIPYTIHQQSKIWHIKKS